MISVNPQQLEAMLERAYLKGHALGKSGIGPVERAWQLDKPDLLAPPLPRPQDMSAWTCGCDPGERYTCSAYPSCAYGSAVSL